MLRRFIVLASCAVIALLAASCRKKGPELTCWVNQVCFVCPSAKTQALCIRDPAAARCKYADPSHCKE